MLDVLHFVFSSFWVWLGSTIMLAMVASAFGSLFGSVMSVMASWGRRHG